MLCVAEAKACFSVASLPYMPLAGNHENANIERSFSPFALRYNMPLLTRFLHPLVLRSVIFFVLSPTNRRRTFIDVDSFTGGDPERYYYSFDFGSVHFINLDSEHDYAVGSAQYR